MEVLCWYTVIIKTITTTTQQKGIRSITVFVFFVIVAIQRVIVHFMVTKIGIAFVVTKRCIVFVLVVDSRIVFEVVLIIFCMVMLGLTVMAAAVGTFAAVL
jgi:hypothetical protein